jgi:hypothetical protein
MADTDEKKKVLDELDEDLREIKEGVDAARAWSDVACRIADALEHTIIAQTFMQLAAAGMQPQGEGFTLVGHRAACPGCMILKNAKPAGTKIVPANGMPIIGRKH